MYTTQEKTYKILWFWTGYGGRKLQRNFSPLYLKHFSIFNTPSTCFITPVRIKLQIMRGRCAFICYDKDMEESSSRIESNPQSSSDISWRVKFRSYSFRKRNSNPGNHNGGRRRSVGRSVSFKHPLSSCLNQSPRRPLLRSSLSFPQVCIVHLF